MSSNASPRALRAAVLSAPLADYAPHRLEVDCGTVGCARDRRYRISDLAGVHGKATLIRALVRRLRCQDCGRAPVSVVLVATMGVQRPWVTRTELVGRG